jgi:hemerythrin superfamily protein
MSIFDKVAAKIMPPESAQDRAEARRKAEELASDCPFLVDVLDHHRRIERGFAKARSASDASSRTAALKGLALILTAHANAEETVLYPAMADTGEKAHAGMGYQEQAIVKIEMAKLEMIEPMSQEWTDKLEHIEGAVAHHVYEEEGTWFPELKKAILPAQHHRIIKRFREEFDRYSQRTSATSQGVDTPEMA